MKKTLHSPEYLKLIAWLKAVRRARGMTIRELAAELEVSHSFVGKVEQGERRLDVMEFVSYCRALGISDQEGMKAVYGAKN